MKALTGVVETGLFVGMDHLAIVGTDSDVKVIE
ncbi:MAG: hypothetical protein ACJ754_20500 [Pyrinomonadaceae bacterium]